MSRNVNMNVGSPLRPAQQDARFRPHRQGLPVQCAHARHRALHDRVFRGELFHQALPRRDRHPQDHGPRHGGFRARAGRGLRSRFHRRLAFGSIETAMKISAIDSYVLTVPTPQPMARSYAHQKLVVADIATDEGVKGLGYSLVFGGGGAEAVLAYLRTRLAPGLLGEDPLRTE